LVNRSVTRSLRNRRIH